MIVFRLCKSIYSRDLSGKGAEKYGGRWNSEGRAVIYTSESRALAVTELAVHMPLSIIPNDLRMVSIKIPDDASIFQIKLTDLKKNWKATPYHPGTQKLGDNWIRDNNYLVLKVPSAVIAGDYNYLINPNHENFRKIKIVLTEKFDFDNRLFNQLTN